MSLRALALLHSRETVSAARTLSSSPWHHLPCRAIPRRSSSSTPPEERDAALDPWHGSQSE
eukprot:690832-Rhodomonas_salina.1